MGTGFTPAASGMPANWTILNDDTIEAAFAAIIGSLSLSDTPDFVGNNIYLGPMGSGISDGVIFTDDTGTVLFHVRPQQILIHVSDPAGEIILDGNAVTVGEGFTDLGFFGAVPIAKPGVVGSRGGNAALANLLTALANLGLITNGTTA